jgi:hypothetical protein
MMEEHILPGFARLQTADGLALVKAANIVAMTDWPAIKGGQPRTRLIMAASNAYVEIIVQGKAETVAETLALTLGKTPI